MVVPLQLKNGRASTTATVIETENVQVVGNGTINFRRDRIAMNFRPQPKRQNMVRIVTPFSLEGDLSNPAISIPRGKVAGRVVGEVVTLPFNFLGAIAGSRSRAEHKPCQIIQTEKRKPTRKRRRSR